MIIFGVPVIVHLLVIVIIIIINTKDWTPATNNRCFTKPLLYHRSVNVELLLRHDCHTGAAAAAAGVLCGSSLVLPCNVTNGHVMTLLCTIADPWRSSQPTYFDEVHHF